MGVDPLAILGVTQGRELKTLNAVIMGAGFVVINDIFPPYHPITLTAFFSACLHFFTHFTIVKEKYIYISVKHKKAK